MEVPGFTYKGLKKKEDKSIGMRGFFSFLFPFFNKLIHFILCYFWLRWVFATARGLLIVVASPVAEHRLQARGPQQLRHAGSAVVARRL